MFDVRLRGIPRRELLGNLFADFAGAINTEAAAPELTLKLVDADSDSHGDDMFKTCKHSRSASRQPDHVAKITPTLSVSVWQSHDIESGAVRMHWDVSRISSEDPSKTFKTLKIDSLLEFPTFLARVATGFAQTEAVSNRLRAELIQFAKDMESIVARRSSNGEDQSGETEDDLFRS